MLARAEPRNARKTNDEREVSFIHYRAKNDVVDTI